VLDHVTGLRCTLCDRVEPATSLAHTCPSCGPRGILDVEYDLGRVRLDLASDRRQDIRRYLPLMPLPADARVTPLAVGMTPIVEAPALAKALGIGRLWIKDDGRQPTASFKDRATFVGTARALMLGKTAIAAASTGNAATSLAGLAASLGLDAHIFVPRTAPEAKVAQLLVYGARVFLVDADYDRTYDLCQQAVARYGWYDRSAAVNPYLVEGKKTAGHELAEQLAATPPDWVSISVGDGCCFAGTWKGLQEMHQLGVLSRLPRMLGTQAAGAAPLVHALDSGASDIVPVEAHTVADSINVGNPRNPRKALRAARAAHGAMIAVSDEDILDMLPRLARASGVFGEPTGVAGLAGIRRARERGLIGPNDTVVHVVTGSGLKDVRGAMRTVTLPAPIAPHMDAVAERLATL
jgi:threonine synthase